MKAYVKLVQHFGSEFTILLDADVDDLERGSSSILAEAIKRVRTGKVIRQPGYDGEFGVVKVFSEKEKVFEEICVLEYFKRAYQYCFE